MNIPDTVRSFLATRGGQYKSRAVPAGRDFNETAEIAKIEPYRIARAVLVKSGKAILMAVIRSDQELDLAKIAILFKREFTLCSDSEAAQLIPTDEGYLPPLAEPYGLRAIIDKSLTHCEDLFFTSGNAGQFIYASRDDFLRLHTDSWKKHTIVTGIESHGEAVEVDANGAYKRKVEGVGELPAMPGLASEIIRIRNNPYSQASELAAVIEQDPSLSAQLIRYALSPLYSYQGKVVSVEQAIIRVLGMDFVLDIAFGLALGKRFNNPKEGPIGLKAFWSHAVLTAALTQTLCNAIDYSRRPPPGVGYLAGLLHNFGLLLLGHLFPDQFRRLNSALTAQPERPIYDVEREELGVTHNEMGLWLMDAWDMPREITEAVQHHHNPDHRSDFSIFANLVYIANALLRRHGIGDASSMAIPDELLKRVGLDQVKVELALASVMADQEGMAFMASKMAA